MPSPRSQGKWARKQAGPCRKKAADPAKTGQPQKQPPRSIRCHGAEDHTEKHQPPGRDLHLAQSSGRERRCVCGSASPACCQASMPPLGSGEAIRVSRRNTRQSPFALRLPALAKAKHQWSLGRECGPAGRGECAAARDPIRC